MARHDYTLTPAFLARLPVEEVDIKTRLRNGPQPVYHYRGTIEDFLEGMQANPRATAGREERLAWAGCTNGETIPGLLQGNCPTAFKAFEDAAAKLRHAPKRAKPVLSVVGGSFSMGRILIGHPVACYRRPRTALAPKTLEFSISPSWRVNAEDIAAVTAKIARAASDYRLAGGAVRVTMHYAIGFSAPNPQTRARGLIVSLDVSLANAMSTAFSMSVQFPRMLVFGLAQHLSGERDDGLPLVSINKPGLVQLVGRMDEADKALEALKIDA